MAKAKQRPNLLRILGTLVLIALLCYFCYMYINQQIVLNRQNEQITRMETENARLEEAYQQMLAEVNDHNTLDYVEKYMRSHFGMVQKDEIRIDVIEK